MPQNSDPSTTPKELQVKTRLYLGLGTVSKVTQLWAGRARIWTQIWVPSLVDFQYTERKHPRQLHRTSKNLMDGMNKGFKMNVSWVVIISFSFYVTWSFSPVAWSSWHYYPSSSSWPLPPGLTEPAAPIFSSQSHQNHLLFSPTPNLIKASGLDILTPSPFLPCHPHMTFNADSNLQPGQRGHFSNNSERRAPFPCEFLSERACKGGGEQKMFSFCQNP